MSDDEVIDLTQSSTSLRYALKLTNSRQFNTTLSYFSSDDVDCISDVIELDSPIKKAQSFKSEIR